MEPSTSDHIDELVAANRILARENVLDAFGHVSIRDPANPSQYLLARSRSPALVRRADIMTFTLESAPVGGDKRLAYNERFIHGAIYEARPDVNAVIHSHAEDVLPFTLTPVPLRPIIHVASCIGAHVPVWDIAERFGDTNMQVRNVEQGRELARAIGNDRVALMRGHGFAAAGASLLDVVRIGVYLPQNARVYMNAARLGPVTPLSEGEIRMRAEVNPVAPDYARAWEYWLDRAGVAL
jgi:ribulose-5-phosphate 4-epimerase/fuculose-1-phosphate aldolase